MKYYQRGFIHRNLHYRSVCSHIKSNMDTISSKNNLSVSRTNSLSYCTIFYDIINSTIKYCNTLSETYIK